LSQELGFDKKSVDDEDEVDDKVIAFLKLTGKVVERSGSEYVKAYYDYKNRLDNDPRHKDKSDGHKNNMAKRYMIKLFLQHGIYPMWRKLEGLPVAEPYEVSKLKLTHSKATFGKPGVLPEE
ncbi:MAG TPA: hypothetical protein VN843_30655, partial [Anaerolineales bacterium]|nr:hypothetical protein [Anaerolineales bacterium]